MRSRKLFPIFPVVLLLFITSLACGGSAIPASTETATELPKTSTKTLKPTSTPRPSPTPDMAATLRADEFNSFLQGFSDEGYISTMEGEYLELDPFKEEWAQLGWYDTWVFDETFADFVFKAHFKWSTANATPEISGCGIVFGIQENDDHYAVFLDKSRILFLMGRGSNIYNVGKTRGSGRANFGNPAEADFAVSVKGQSAFVSVDGDVTEYTLSADQTSQGNFGYTLLSGTNRDYGTRCEMTDVILWTPQ